MSQFVRWPAPQAVGRSAARAHVITPPVQGNVALSVTASDASVTTDAATRGTIAFARTASDASATTDSAAGIRTGGRTASDASATSDAATRGTIPFARSASDTSATTDAATRALALGRTASDTTVTTDSVAVVWTTGGINATASDTSVTTDSATRAFAQARTASDSSVTTDAATRAVAKARTASDVSVTTDAATRLGTYPRTGSDASATTDAATRGATHPRTATDTSATTDTATRGTIAFARTASDTSVTTDAATLGVYTDNFNRADGGLGASWIAGSDGEQHIASNQLQGDAAAIRSAYRGETYSSDQYSEIQATSTAPPSADWVGPSVRTQNSGQDCYLVIYFNDNSTNTYRLVLYKRVSGTFTDITPIGSAPGPSGYTLNGPLSAGDAIRLSVAGSEVRVLLNGKRVIKTTDTSIATGGAPGIITFGASTADNWQGANASAETAASIQTFTTTPPNNADNGGAGSAYHIQVLAPDNPTPGVPHNFLYVLPVDPDLANNYGNGLDMLYGLNVHNQYNVTIIQPAFGIGSWYADNDLNATLHHETYMVSDLVPWVTSNFTTSGTEKHWLLGFSRSGFGGMGLLFKHPNVFARGAFWDWPFDMNTSNYATYGAGTAVYGTAGNFTSNYQMTSTYLDTYKAPFQIDKRIWIGSHQSFQTDIADADTQFTAKSILHTLDPDILRAHRWDSGWAPNAMVALAAPAVSLRTASDASTTTDAATRTLALGRTASDASTTTDAATRATAKARTASDASATTDSAAGVATRGRTAGDASATADSATRAATHPRTSSDASVTSDTATRILSRGRAASDASATSDATVRGVIHYTRTASDLSVTLDAAYGPGGIVTAPRIHEPTKIQMPSYSSSSTLPAYATKATAPSYATMSAMPTYASDATMPQYAGDVEQPAYTAEAAITVYAAKVATPTASGGI